MSTPIQGIRSSLQGTPYCTEYSGTPYVRYGDNRCNRTRLLGVGLKPRERGVETIRPDKKLHSYSVHAYGRQPGLLGDMEALSWAGLELINGCQPRRSLLVCARMTPKKHARATQRLRLRPPTYGVQSAFHGFQVGGYSSLQGTGYSVQST